MIRLPDARVPALQLRWRNEASKTLERRYLHPQTGPVLAHTDTLAGSAMKLARRWLAQPCLSSAGGAKATLPCRVKTLPIIGHSQKAIANATDSHL